MKFLYKNILWLLLLSIQNLNAAQIFSGSGGALADLDTSRFNIVVSGLSYSTIDTSYGIESVSININHTNDQQLHIFIASPDGTLIELSTKNGGSGDNYSTTIFRMDSAAIINFGGAPFNGSFIPEGHLFNINNSQNGNGTWQLRIFDDTWSTVGSLTSWSLKFSDNPAKPIFKSSMLPVFVINTNHQFIADSPKILCDLGVINNGPGNRNFMCDPFNGYNGKIRIEIRGSSSQSFPKKSYGFSTVNSGGVNQSFPLLGFPSEYDWVLSANYTDKTFTHNALPYQLSNEMGHYATRTQFVDLVINGTYMGVYVFMESIKRGSNRVNISNLKTSDTTGTQLKGGYILKIDKTTGAAFAGWTSPYQPVNHPNGQVIRYQYQYPKGTAIQPQQASYIHAYVDSFENALFGANFQDPFSGWRKYAGINSFIDYFILDEISKNVDGYRISTFLHKDKNGKIKYGPVWDYDIAWGNANYCSGNTTSGWAYQFPCTGDGLQPPAHWARLMEDTSFANTLRCRWDFLRTNILSTSGLNIVIDSMASVINESKDLNFKVWPILGIYIWPNPTPLATSYAGEIANMKSWLQNRMTWLDANMPGYCSSVALPVDLLSFDAEPDKNFVDLNWSTASEINNDYFTIERSVDGFEWDEIETIKGAGNSSHTLNYETTDKAPMPGISYYRLKQTDYDGNYSYSEIKAVKLLQHLVSLLYPDPSDGKNIFINLENRLDGNAAITIHDTQGKLVYENHFDAEGARQIQVDDLSLNKSGIYFLKLSTENFEVNHKFVVQ